VRIIAGKVFKGSQEIHVAPLELRLIACLQPEPRIYTKQEIAEYVYFEEQGLVEDQRIEGLVCRLRKKLGDRYIKTYRRRGYELLR
jgi:DNA-binding response OmpR family regulator